MAKQSIQTNVGTVRIGTKIRIIRVDDKTARSAAFPDGIDNQASSLNGKTGVVTSIDDVDSLRGTWGTLAVLPDVDSFEIVKPENILPMSRIIHNIVASTVLASAMRYIKKEFMVGVRGYLRVTEQDDDLFIRCEHAMRDAAEAVLSERDCSRYICPHCGSIAKIRSCDNLEQRMNRDGVEHMVYSGKCETCGNTFYAVYRYMGTLTEEELARKFGS